MGNVFYGSGTKRVSSTINALPLLQDTLPTTINCAAEKKKISERITSAKGRIANSLKVQEFYALESYVFRVRTKNFFLDLSAAARQGVQIHSRIRHI